MSVSIHCLTFNYVEENTYILVDDATKEAAIIDCGCMNLQEQTRLEETIEQLGAIPRYLLFTHLHFDHTWGCSFAAQRYDLLPRAHDVEIQKMPPFGEQLRSFGFGMIQAEPQPEYLPLQTGEVIRVGDTSLKVLFVPGHTPGHIAFYSEEEGVVFVGDVLFDQGGIGRTDFPGGSFTTLIESINRELVPLPKTTQVFSGHGPSFTIESVHKYNSYI